MKKLVKWVLKRLTHNERRYRMLFVGKRLKIQQWKWLHFTNHPWEDNKNE